MALPPNETSLLSNITGIPMDSESVFLQRPITSQTQSLSLMRGVLSPVKSRRLPHSVTPVVERKLRPRPVPRTPFSSPQKGVHVPHRGPLKSKNTRTGDSAIESEPKDEKGEERLTDRSCAPSPPSIAIIEDSRDMHEIDLGIEVLTGEEMKFGMNRKRKIVARTTGTTKKLKISRPHGSKKLRNRDDIAVMKGSPTCRRGNSGGETSGTESLPAFVASAKGNDSEVVGNEEGGVKGKIHVRQKNKRASVVSRDTGKGPAIHGYNLRSSPRGFIRENTLVASDVNLQSDDSKENGENEETRVEFKLPELPLLTRKELGDLEQDDQYASSSTKIQLDNTPADGVIQSDEPMYYGDLSYSNICTTPYPCFDSCAVSSEWVNFNPEILDSPMVIPGDPLNHGDSNMVTYNGLDWDFNELQQAQGLDRMESVQGVNGVNSGDALQQFENTMDLRVGTYLNGSYEDENQDYPDLDQYYEQMLPHFIVPLPFESDSGSESSPEGSSNVSVTETIEIPEPGSGIQHGDGIGGEWLEWKEYEINDDDTLGWDNPVHIEQDWGKWTENIQG